MHTLPLMVQVSLLLAYHLHHQNQSERKCLSKICQICWSASHLCGFLFSLIININDDFVPFKSRLLIMCLLNQNCEMFTKYVNHEVMLKYFMTGNMSLSPIQCSNFRHVSQLHSCYTLYKSIHMCVWECIILRGINLYH